MSHPVKCLNPECGRDGVVLLQMYAVPVGYVCAGCIPPNPAQAARWWSPRMELG